MRQWTKRQWAAAAGGTAAALVVLGVPTVLIPNGLFAREIEPTWWSYPVWALAAVLSGLLLATYVRTGPAPRDDTRPDRRGLGGTLLTWFAIGCPVCNKLVLLAVGASGALNWFAPLQPLLALAGLALLALALRARLRTAASCEVRPRVESR
ncbi:hypothetical protein [Nocardiopsis composta]|uniref:Uncharacterized protein n=1 Tax=Nocardiopsis composta TaxID=157465 RepID=A0A7W8QIS9_9ACTN|nr:hypothetical protein [Nocardiopsis composta]MBB5431263.1 hypothetical protein [Nocardiopsis composta]